MHRIARRVGTKVSGLVRVDLYPHNGTVYFSELTFTPRGCGAPHLPLAVEGLLMNVLDNRMLPSDATADFVERTINNRDWVLVKSSNGTAKITSVGYASPVDLCMSFTKDTLYPTTDMSHDQLEKDVPLFQRCIKEAKKAVASPARCLHTEGHGAGASIEAVDAALLASGLEKACKAGSPLH